MKVGGNSFVARVRREMVSYLKEDLEITDFVLICFMIIVNIAYLYANDSVKRENYKISDNRGIVVDL